MRDPPAQVGYVDRESRKIVFDEDLALLTPSLIAAPSWAQPMVAIDDGATTGILRRRPARTPTMRSSIDHTVSGASGPGEFSVPASLALNG